MKPNIHVRTLKRATGVRNNLFGAFDCETWGLEPKAFAIGVCKWYDDTGTVQTARFTKPTEMFSFMFSYRFRNYRWYAHNAEYDLLAICDNPLKDFDKILFSKSLFIFASKKIGKNNVTVCDTFNLFKEKLEKIGESIGYAKFETPKKFLQNHPQKITERDWFYCERDVEITLLSVRKFKDWVFEHFHCNIGMTIASTALKIWQTNYAKEMFIDTEKSMEFRKSYYGGRSECFIKGVCNERLFYYDINSLYPFVYSNIQFPNPENLRKGKGKNSFLKVLNNSEGVANVTIKCDMEYPILPYKSDGKLIFPNGEFSGYYNFNEIRFALENGYTLIDVDDYIYSAPIETPFGKYGKEIYGKRLEYKASGDAMGDTFCKYLLNSLYGKFGEIHDGAEWGCWNEPIEGKIFSEVRDGFGYWRTLDDKEIITEHTVFPFCSYVTSAARIELYKLFQKANTIYYCDTDSIITPTELECGTELGQIKLEGVIVSATILKPKEYALTLIEGTQITKYKGIPNRALPTSLFEPKIKIEKYIKSKEGLRRNLQAGKAITVTKRNDYLVGDKRQFQVVDYTNAYSTSIPLEIHNCK